MWFAGCILRPNSSSSPATRSSALTADADAMRAQWRHWLDTEMGWLDRCAVPLWHTPGNHTTYDEMSEAVFREVLKLPFVDLGGLMIFGLPPSEVAIHESATSTSHEFWLMCENIADFTGEMTKRGIAFSTPMHRGWGTMTEITLPGGGKLGVYQPHHGRPKTVAAKAAAKEPAAKKATSKKKPAKKAAKKMPAKKAAKKKTRSKRR